MRSEGRACDEEFGKLRNLLEEIVGTGTNVVIAAKGYVSSRKMDLHEKATVRFETMPGKQGQMDWGFF